MKLYIAGPMTGYDRFNFPAFHAAAAQLRAVGYEVVSPAEMDEAEGFDPTTGQGLRPFSDYMARDLAAIDGCDGVALLDGWETSAGATKEREHAYESEKPAWLASHWLSWGNRPLCVQTETRVTDPTTGGEKCRKLARFDLLPWDALHELAEHYGKCGGDGTGPGKYEDRNWERGYDWSLSFGALMRHAAAFWTREDIDDASQSRHVIAMAWHCMTLAAFQIRQAGNDDRPNTKGSK